MIKNPIIYLHKGDIASDINFGKSIAIDTETMGLDHRYNRLCLVQISSGDGVCHLVQIQPGVKSPNLISILNNLNIEKIFHFARFDLAVLKNHFGMNIFPVYCTKVASKLSRTFTDKHSLKELCKHLLKIDISKQECTSDWGVESLTDAQQVYAATDVLYLHALQMILAKLLEREGRSFIAKSIFNFLPTRAELDLLGFIEPDILNHF